MLTFVCINRKYAENVLVMILNSFYIYIFHLRAVHLKRDKKNKCKVQT